MEEVCNCGYRGKDLIAHIENLKSYDHYPVIEWSNGDSKKAYVLVSHRTNKKYISPRAML